MASTATFEVIVVLLAGDAAVEIDR
ncbi:hypothetical protein EYZ11_001305 [Aspergillus tanneri]|uniref:Uncharacterized protein n=1 Tax=Aspergillus tanneri TaxID=1220188 RepID=A0A4S3JUZ8_9EURO|nr:hypothetical protein EYZ11_001305 [Aspergillus tanneri]